MLLWTRARLKSGFYLPDLSLLRFSAGFQHTGKLLLRVSRVVLCFMPQKVLSAKNIDAVKMGLKVMTSKVPPVIICKAPGVVWSHSGILVKSDLLSQSVVGEAVRLLGFLFFLSRLNKQKRDQSVSSTAMLSLPVEQQRAGRRMHGIAVFIWLSVMLV